MLNYFFYTNIYISILYKIFVMKNHQIYNLHISFPQALYRELKAESKLHKVPTTKLVREAVEIWLKRKKAATLEKSIIEYALQCAGTKDDLDEDLEEASLEVIHQIDNEDVAKRIEVMCIGLI